LHIVDTLVTMQSKMLLYVTETDNIFSKITSCTVKKKTDVGLI